MWPDSELQNVAEHVHASVEDFDVVFDTGSGNIALASIMFVQVWTLSLYSLYLRGVANFEMC